MTFHFELNCPIYSFSSSTFSVSNFHSPHLSLLFLAAVCQNTLSSALFHPHCCLSLTHTGHYVKRCGPLDGRQCNQLIKSCFDHQHQSVSAWRAPESVVWFCRVPVTLTMTHVMWLGRVSFQQTVQGLPWTMLWIPVQNIGSAPCAFSALPS